MGKLFLKSLAPYFLYLRGQFVRHRGFIRMVLIDLIFLLIVFQLLRVAGLIGFDFILRILTVLTTVCAGILLMIDERDWTARLESERESDKKWPAGRICGLLTLIVLAGILLKLIRIDNIGVYTDEWNSLVNAKNIAEHGTTTYFVNGQVTEPYTRALFLLYLTGAFVKGFGTSLTAARLPVIILSSLTAIPFYFLGAKVSRKAGFIAALLWLISPWSIMIGRLVREYAVFPLFYLLILWMLTVFADRALQLMEDRRTPSLKEILLGGAGFIFPLYYMLVLDKFSTFEQALVVYAVSVLYFVYIVWNSPRARSCFSGKRVMYGVILAVMILGAYIYLNRYAISWWEMDFWPRFSAVWPDKILGDHTRSWFYMTGAYSVFLFLAVGTFSSLMLFFRRRFPVAFFYTIAFYASFYVYTFHFARYVRARYGFIMHVLLIPVLAIGIYFLYLLLWPKKGESRIISVLLIVLLLLTFNPMNTYRAVFKGGSGYDLITEEHLYKFEEMAAKYGAEMKDQFILCTTCNPLLWYGIADLEHNKVERLIIDPNDITVTESAIVAAREKFEHGWILLDQWRFRNEGRILEKPLVAKDYVFDFVDHLSSFYLYRW